MEAFCPDLQNRNYPFLSSINKTTAEKELLHLRRRPEVHFRCCVETFDQQLQQQEHCLDGTDLHGKALAPYVKNPTTAIPDLVHSWSVSILPSFSPILFSMSLSTKLGEIGEKNLAVGRRAKPRPDFPGQKISSKLISSVFYEYKTFSSSFSFFTSHIKDQQRQEDEQERRDAAAPTSSSSNFSSQLPRYTKEIRAFSLNLHHTKMKKNCEKEVSDNHTL
jgi:hypothetical protein